MYVGALHCNALCIDCVRYWWLSGVENRVEKASNRPENFTYHQNQGIIPSVSLYTPAHRGRARACPAAAGGQLYYAKVLPGENFFFGAAHASVLGPPPERVAIPGEALQRVENRPPRAVLSPSGI